MTRNEFLEITTLTDLIDWCNENGCEECIDIYDREGYDSEIDFEIEEWDDSWTDLRDYLNDLPNTDDYDWFRRDDYYGGWQGLYDDDDIVEDRLEGALEYGDDHDFWDGEEDQEEEDVEEEFVDEEPCVEEDDPTDYEPIETEDVSIGDLFMFCSSDVQRIVNDATKADGEDDEAWSDEFCEFVNDIVSVVEGR